MRAMRKTFTLTPHAVSVLGGVGNASAYLSQLIVDAQTDWQHALGELYGAGWRAPEVLAASEALIELTRSRGVGLPIDAQLRRGAEAASEYCIDGRRWARLCRQIDDSDRLRMAIAVVAREYWRDNAALRAELGAD